METIPSDRRRWNTWYGFVQSRNVHLVFSSLITSCDYPYLTSMDFAQLWVCHPSPQKRPLYPPSGFYGHTYANSRGQYNPHKHARGNLRGSYTSMYRYRISARLFEMIRPRVKLHLSIVTMTPHLVTSFSFPSCQLSPSLPHIIYRFQFPTEIERLRISRFFDTWTVDFKGI